MRFLAWVSVLVLLVTFVGCKQPPKEAKKPDPKNFVLITNHAAKEVSAAAESVAGKMEVTSIKKVEGTTAAGQVAALKEAQGADGVAIDCIPTPEVAAAVAELVGKGVPVVTYYSDCPTVGEVGRTCFVGADLGYVGKLAAATLLEQIGEDGGLVAVISGPETPVLKAIEVGIADFLDQPRVTVKGPERAALSAGGVEAAIQKVLGEESSIAGWIIINPAAVPTGEVNPLAKLGTARVVLLSGTEAGLKAADENKIVLAPQFAVYGQMAIQMLHGITRKHTVFSSVLHVDPQVVTLSNVEKMTADLEAIQAGEKIVPVVPARPLK